MVSSLATLLSMLENIAQRLSRLWARVANLNELPGNSTATDRQRFPTDARDARTSFPNRLAIAPPCGPECAMPDAALAPRAESETVCCMQSDECSAGALPGSSR